MTNLKKYNIFVTLTSFAKLLVELFIPLLLYEKNFLIKEIILFLIIKYTLCTLYTPLTIYIGRKISYTKIMFISSILFSLTYIYINFIKHNLISLIILSLIYSLYLSFYWIGRHIYALSIIEDKKITDNTSLYQIFTLLGGLPATLIGAKILKSFGFLTLSIIVLILMILSIIPLLKIKPKKENKTSNIKEIIKTFPIRNYLFIIIDQLKYSSLAVFPLYTYLYIKKEFTYLGILNIICGIGSILYIYILSKQMDKNKKDYLKPSSILLGIIFILKITITNSIFFLIITFFEGIMKSTLDTIILRNTYAYGKNYQTDLYIGFIEFLNNFTRIIIFLISYIFNISLKGIIILGIIGIITNSFIGFNDGKYGYKNN